MSRVHPVLAGRCPGRARVLPISGQGGRGAADQGVGGAGAVLPISCRGERGAADQGVGGAGAVLLVLVCSTHPLSCLCCGVASGRLEMLSVCVY